MDMKHLNYIDAIAKKDCALLREKEATYKGSWKKRGGLGAFMMLARKWDRMENILCPTRMHVKDGVMRTAQNYDVFEEIMFDPKSGEDGTLLAEIRDLRRYLLLVEAEIASRMNLVPKIKIDGKEVESNFAVSEDKTTVWMDRPSHILRGPSNTGDITNMDDLFTAGTPDDGGHHESDEPKWLERLNDGLQTADIEPHQRSLYISMPHGGRNYNIVNRNKVDPTMWEHLPRLQKELNNKEYEETMPEYQGLYLWNEGGSKWVMQERYRQNWGDL